ncbi:GntR family transcriptional regulator [Couchioplanes caeruleus]|uniref:GntR family transcriptional regulator n=2 Tax=Couchioplanes caeruleus TaxID=56438 RepID=A0A1K0FCG2_9ACTN|nr:GntR family transcriptional regulator [Couchioplanes caeruleus]OJF10535.1 GntR family transcriptional regulator [Couchioplanes caeruleus subsp. caeruleus]ROP28630.1 GntR family transcriptional regulator [Couchioplanes caeruleus]
MSSPVNVAVDRRSPVPLYFQVAQQIEAMIDRGELLPGARLENEVVLADQMGLSRPTMRQAIQYLVDKGLLVRKRGVGTQVVHGQVKRNVELSSLHDDLLRANQYPTTKVISATVVPATDDIAVALHQPPGAEVVRLERLRYANDQPLAILQNWLPTGLADLTPERLERQGLYALLRAVGVTLRVASQRIGARAATGREATLLTERRGAPLLTMVRTTYDDSGRAVEYGSHVYRPALYSFEMALVER